MPSSYSASLRFELQFTGENVNLWGDKLNAALSRADDAIAGFATIALVGNLSLTTANGSADQARLAMLKFTGAGGYTVTAPAVSKRYDVWNATTGVLTFSNGSSSVSLVAGEACAIITDGGANISKVQPQGYANPVNAGDVSTKSYVDAAVAAAVYSTGTFGVAITPGDAGKFLTNNGTTPSWAVAATLTDIANAKTASAALAIAFAAAL